MILRDVSLVLAAGAGWIAVAPTRRVTRWVALWQAIASGLSVALHLRGRVAWELGVRRPAYLAAFARGVAIDRGVSLWLGAALLGVAVCALRWRSTPLPGLTRNVAGAAAIILITAAWSLHPA